LTTRKYHDEKDIYYSCNVGIFHIQFCTVESKQQWLHQSVPVKPKQITISGGDLGAGMFLYSLIVDGQE